MNAFQNCSDTKDSVEFFPPQGLYLKPIARLNVSVQLPQVKLPGKTISNWEVMEKLRTMIKPEEFTSLKVSKSTLEFIRFEGEIETKSKLSYVIGRLDGRTMKLAGFTELLKIRAAEAKISFPTRHTWDSYFRDAKNMNEMKPGERPDTIHISNLPCKWFAAKQDVTKGNDKPSEYIFRKVFEVFGDVRCIDIPAADPYRNRMKAHISGIKMFSFGQDLSFEGYVQFKEYICFVKAMDALRGMKLLYKDGDNAYTASIKVDFDKTKHLSEPTIRRRRTEREKLMAVDHEREEKERLEQEAEEERMEKERQQKLEEKRMKTERQRQREDRRKEKFLLEMKEKETQEMNLKIALEERKLLIAQRKLESIRLLDELFERLKNAAVEQNISNTGELTTHEKAAKESLEKQGKTKLKSSKQERELRHKLARRYKSLDQQCEQLRQAVEGEHSGHRNTNDRLSPSPSSSSSSSSTRSSITTTSNSPTSEIQRGSKWKDKKEDSHYDSNYYFPNEQHFYNNAMGYSFPEGMNEYIPQSYNSFQCGNPRFHHYRGGPRFYPRRRGFFIPHWQRYPRGRGKFQHLQPRGTHNPHFYQDVNEEYYRYFQKLAKQDLPEDDECSYSNHSSYFSNSKSRSRSKSISKSKYTSKLEVLSSKYRPNRSKSRTKSHRSRSGSKSRRSRSRTRSRSRSRSRLHKSRSHSLKSRSNRWTSRSRTRSISQSPRTKSLKLRSRSRSSRSFSTSWSFSRSHSPSWAEDINGTLESVNIVKSCTSHNKKHKKHTPKGSTKKKIRK